MPAIHTSPDPPADDAPAGGGSRGDGTRVEAPAIDIVDEIFLTVPRRELARHFADPASWRRHWPDLELRVEADRGDKGMRWVLTGTLTGTMEVWLEPVLDGTVLHYYLRANPAAVMSRSKRARWVVEETRRRRLAARRLAFGLKDSAERDRAPGCPPEIVSEQ